MKRRTLLVTLLGAGALPAAQACGTCVEDKIAATYDYAQVQRAAAAGRAVVYCEVAGPWDAARLQAAARKVRGLDAQSLRLSREPAALSFALDTKKQSPQAAVLALQVAAPAGTRIGIVRVVK
jgi:hypothetical protein